MYMVHFIGVRKALGESGEAPVNQTSMSSYCEGGGFVDVDNKPEYKSF